MQGIGIEYSVPSGIFEEAVWRVSGLVAMRVRNLNRGPIQIGRIDTVRDSGSTIALQVGPNQTLVTTHDVIGAEIRARSNVGTGALIAVKGEPNASSSTAGLSAARAFEANITVKGTRTVSSEISALRAFLDVDSEVTVTGLKSVIQIATPNVSGWNHLVHSETGGPHVVEAGTYSTSDGYFSVRVAGNDYRVPFFTAVD